MTQNLKNFLSQSDVAALKAYVQGPSSQARADSTVLLHCTHSNLKNTSFFELRLDRHMTILSVKEKLKSHTGTAVGAMLLQMKDLSGQTVATLSDDNSVLGFYSPQDGFTLHIVDIDPNSASADGWLTDVSKVDKYEISEEDYNARENTYRKFKEQKLKEDPTWTLQKEIAKRSGKEIKEAVSDPEFQSEEAKAISVGNRCEVYPGSKRGEVMFVGKVEGLPLGYWIGVKYDEPIGKNNGEFFSSKPLPFRLRETDVREFRSVLFFSLSLSLQERSRGRSTLSARQSTEGWCAQPTSKSGTFLRRTTLTFPTTRRSDLISSLGAL